MTKTLSLLDELEQIDDALLNSEPTEEQERRGQQLVTLANAAPAMLLALEAAETQLSEYCAGDDGRDTEAHSALRQVRAVIAEAKGIEPETAASGSTNSASKMLGALIETTGLLDAAARNASRLGQPEFAAQLLTMLSVNREVIAEANEMEQATAPSPDLTNTDRAQRARQALKGYNHEWDIVANAIDFLTDLQHYCHLGYADAVRHTTFAELLERATGHFNTEISGEE